MESILCVVFILLASSFYVSQAAVTNCTAAPCDIKTCSNTSTLCNQICSATPCKTECNSPAGCEATCPLGGCSKMQCNVAVPNPPAGSRCKLNCKENCRDMNCNAFQCYPECAKDNCALTCDGSGTTSQCYPRCYGKGCEINCKSVACEVTCAGGSCKVKFGKKSSGAVACQAGKCSLTCAKGRHCSYVNACPNCTGPVYVDDPFPTMKPTSRPTSKPSNQKTCSSAPCDIKTCSNTSTTCTQVCSATPCTTSCSSPGGCDAKCPKGGCSKMSCNIKERSPAVRSDECGLSCKENCQDMNCNAFQCWPKCQKDNCKMTCDGRSVGRRCFPKCFGKGCEINCKSNTCEIECVGGSCKVKVGKNSTGFVECPGGKCSLVCANGSKCGYIKSCPNCTPAKYVDDPFAKPKGNAITVHAAVHVLLVTVIHIFTLLVL